MELLFFVMNQIDKLDQLLKDLSNEKKFSATIIDSAGMARLLADHDYLFGSLRALLNNSQVNSKTIFMVLNHRKERRQSGRAEHGRRLHRTGQLC